MEAGLSDISWSKNPRAWLSTQWTPTSTAFFLFLVNFPPRLIAWDKGEMVMIHFVYAKRSLISSLPCLQPCPSPPWPGQYPGQDHKLKGFKSSIYHIWRDLGPWPLWCGCLFFRLFRSFSFSHFSSYFEGTNFTLDFFWRGSVFADRSTPFPKVHFISASI